MLNNVLSALLPCASAGRTQPPALSFRWTTYSSLRRSIRLAAGDLMALHYEKSKAGKESVNGGGVHIEAPHNAAKLEPHEVIEDLSIVLEHLHLERDASKVSGLPPLPRAA